MGKLVVGIIAITLLQIAFFAYLMSDRVDHAKLYDAGTGPIEKGSPESRRVSRLPDIAVTAVPAAEPEVTIPRRPKLKTPTGAARRPVIIRSEQNVRTVPGPTRTPRTTYAISAESSRENWDTLPTRARASIPSGYTMVLVNHLPQRPETKAREMCKPKKRSYLAKTLPALVKKPWNLIKSVASKLD